MRYVLVMLLGMCTSLAFAQAEEDLLLQYAKKISQVKTLQSNFSEEKHLSLLSQPQGALQESATV